MASKVSWFLHVVLLEFQELDCFVETTENHGELTVALVKVTKEDFIADKRSAFVAWAAVPGSQRFEAGVRRWMEVAQAGGEIGRAVPDHHAVFDSHPQKMYLSRDL